MTPIPHDFKPRAAVAAIIVVGRQSYFLQHRDSGPNIWYPGCWGLFGGTVEAGETTEEALRRELEEELGFAPRNMSYFLDVRFNFGFVSGQLTRWIYEIEIEAGKVAGLELREGVAARAFAAGELANIRIVPNDRFALDIHASRNGRR